uniref:Uncharacterized protein n=1 Tax=Podoviridae sp. ct8Lf7 TaxID=2827723 RepID=A0A8S5S0P2_9CAUD|nr:MAG TPA: hypothetical protein [Podoviridae sp. ct8Lf7]
MSSDSSEAISPIASKDSAPFTNFPTKFGVPLVPSHKAHPFGISDVPLNIVIVPLGIAISISFYTHSIFGTLSLYSSLSGSGGISMDSSYLG